MAWAPGSTPPRTVARRPAPPVSRLAGHDGQPVGRVGGEVEAGPRGHPAWPTAAPSRPASRPPPTVPSGRCRLASQSSAFRPPAGPARPGRRAPPAGSRSHRSTPRRRPSSAGQPPDGAWPISTLSSTSGCGDRAGTQPGQPGPVDLVAVRDDEARSPRRCRPCRVRYLPLPATEVHPTDAVADPGAGVSRRAATGRSGVTQADDSTLDVHRVLEAGRLDRGQRLGRRGRRSCSTGRSACPAAGRRQRLTGEDLALGYQDANPGSARSRTRPARARRSGRSTCRSRASP